LRCSSDASRKIDPLASSLTRYDDVIAKYLIEQEPGRDLGPVCSDLLRFAFELQNGPPATLWRCRKHAGKLNIAARRACDWGLGGRLAAE
jgi:hypothetical protein